MKRDRSVDILRCVGIVLMIMGHIGFGDRFDYWIHGFHMPLFYLVSCFFFKSEVKSVLGFIKKQILKLLVPYLFFAFFHLAFGYFTFGLNLNKEIKDIFFSPTIGQAPIAGALWFLPALFWMEIIFFLILKVTRGKSLLFMSVSVVLGIAGMVITSVFKINLPFALDAALPGILFIATGYFLKINKENRLFSWSFNMKWYVCGILTVLVTVLIFINEEVNFRSGEYGNMLLTYINAVLYTLLLWQICRWTDKICSSKVLSRFADRFAYIGANSIVFLCLNQLPLYVLKKIGFYKLFSGIEYHIMRCVLLVAVILGLCVVSKMLNLKKLRFIIGK